MRRNRPSLHHSPIEEDSLLNLTPLIDVVFVVLIIFILIAPMLETDKIELAFSHANQKKESSSLETSPITIHVREDNSIWINKKKTSATELLPLLRHAKEKHPSRIPQLFHDKKASFGTYQTIKNAVENAGFEELDVILQPGSQ